MSTGGPRPTPSIGLLYSAGATVAYALRAWFNFSHETSAVRMRKPVVPYKSNCSVEVRSRCGA